MQYMHPSSLAGGVGLSDGGFGGMGIGGEGDNDESTEREGGLKLWEGKYQFQKDMLPMFVGEAFGKKVGYQVAGQQRITYLLAADLFNGQEFEFY